MNVDARKIAYQLLEDWETNQTFPNLALKKALREVFDERDRRFITALVYGVVERRITLDHFLNQCLDQPKIKPSVRCLLRMGLYQMFYMDIPASAACNTSVELIKKRGLASFSGLVNAVLRCCDRERETLLALKKADFSVRYSIDPQLVDLLLEQYGKQTFIEMMEGIRTPDTAMYLFHNPKRGSAEAFLSKMAEEGLLITGTELPHLYKCERGFSPENSPSYREGWYHIVGPHSAEAALLMPKGAESILDLCAAPGGKTFILAALSDGIIHSFDLHAHKVQLLKKEAARLGHTNVVPQQNDGTIQIAERIGSTDFVLCDVPCSGLGMMSKKPDIKYKTYQSDDFTTVQYSILQNGASYLKSGGRLVYSTCTIDRRENELLIERFLKENPHFSKDASVLHKGEKLYLPGQGGDGFYIAVLKKD